MSNPRIAIILVNWNGKSNTLDCLSSLLTLEDKDVCVIVCDNASSDGSIPAFLEWGRVNLNGDRKGFQHVKRDETASIRLDCFLTVIEVGENLGFAGGNNVGIRVALAEPSIEAVWLLNNDTEVLSNSLVALRERMAENSRIGICGSTLIYEHDRKTVQSVGVFYWLWLGWGREIGHGLTADHLPTRDRVERLMTYLPGASMLITRAFLTEVGLMEESYFLYYEELDWALRNRRRFDFAWAPQSIVFHREGAALGTHSRGRASDLSIYYMNVNLLRVVRRFAPIYLPLSFCRLSGKALGFLRRRDQAGLRIILLAMIDFLKGRHRTGGQWLTNLKS